MSKFNVSTTKIEDLPEILKKLLEDFASKHTQGSARKSSFGLRAYLSEA
jgi:hypothetical protein